MTTYTRRKFMKTSAVMGAGAAFMVGCSADARNPAEPLYKISLAQWSLVNSFRDGTLDNLDFARAARENGYGAIEYVNQFFMEKAADQPYLQEMKDHAENEGVENVLIMCDQEGRLGARDDAERLEAIENHYKWVDAARFLGCHAIRVNAFSEGLWDEQRDLIVDGVGRLMEYAAEQDMNLLIENHGGLSSNADWLVEVMEQIGHPRCGTLPDFGNFRISEDEFYDPYEGTRKLMPYAMGVSVKDMGHDAEGNRIEIDFVRMMRIVLDSGFRGYCGVEYGGLEGIAEARMDLESVREQLASEYQ